MARPRIFVSSTFYDLRQVRSDLERFVRDWGFDPVLHERGSIPYGNAKKLEEYCYEEIANCDMLVSLVGGRFGSDSTHQPYSVSQMELRTALEQGKQVYVFVEKAVLFEYRTFLINKAVEGVKFQHVDDSRVYSFLEEVHLLPLNNQIAGFETASEITTYLREQWSGLFHQLLQQKSELKAFRILENMQGTVKTLNQLVSFLTAERRNADQAIQHILLSNHPFFEQLKTLLEVQYRVYFTNHDEMTSWLNARSYSRLSPDEWDTSDIEVWQNKDKHSTKTLFVPLDLFDAHERLKVVTREEWEPERVSLSISNTYDDFPSLDEDDDLPF